jgi:uncharacterized protein
MASENITSSMSIRALLQDIRRVFALDWGGIHGAPHWARVRLNGLRLARTNGARADVVELFALVHDSRRVHDGRDEDHGARAAQLAKEWNCTLLRLDVPGLEMLRYACRYHSDGMTEADITVQTCWDADRLDLGRVGTRPDTRRLCTDGARDQAFLEAAFQRGAGVPVWARDVR